MNLLLTDDSDFTGQRYQLSIHAKSGGSLLGFLFLISFSLGGPFFVDVNDNQTVRVKQGELIWHPGYL